MLYFFNYLRQCVRVVSLCEGFMAYAFLFAGIGEYVVCAGTSAYGLKINMLYVILFNFLRQCVRVVSLCEGFIAYAFLFAGIGEYRCICFKIAYCFGKYTLILKMTD